MEAVFEMPTVLGRLQNRLLSTSREIAEDLAGILPQLTAWEDSHLLDNPTPERLREHKEILDQCLVLGWMLERAAEQPDFPDRRLAEMIKGAVEILRDKKAMWHGQRLSRGQSDRIIATCFPE